MSRDRNDQDRKVPRPKRLRSKQGRIRGGRSPPP